MDLLPKFLKDIIDNFNLEQVVLWIKEIFIFLFKPQKFVTLFYQQSIKKQINQLIFYTGLLLLTFFSFGYGNSQQQFYKQLFIVFFISIPFVLINLCSFYFLSKIRSNVWKVFSFIYISWTFFLIPILVFSYIFLKTENYSFLFLSNAFNSIATIYSLFLIWSVFSDSILRIIFGYVLNIFLLNIFFLLIALVFRDPYSNTKNLDPILNEYEITFSQIKSFSGEPYSFRQSVNYEEKKIQNEIGFLDNDTLKYYGDEHIRILRNLYNNNIKYIDSVKPKLIFNRNREMVSDLSNHFKVMNSYFDYYPCDTCLVKHKKIIRRKDSVVIEVTKEYLIDKPYHKNYNMYQNKIDKIIKGNEYGTSPQLLLEFLLKPLDLLAEQMEWYTGETSSILIN